MLGAVRSCPRARELERDGQPPEAAPRAPRPPLPEFAAAAFMRFLGVATGVAVEDRVPGAVLPIMFM